MKNPRPLQLPELFAPCLTRFSLLTWGCLALIVLTLPAASQTVAMKSQPVRITVPKGVASNVVATVTITMTGTFTTGVNFAVAGVPAGCTGSLTTNNINVAGTHSATLNFSSPDSLAQGEYELTIEATGEASYRLPVPVNCSYIWSGFAYTNGTSANFNHAGNWLGGAVPGDTDNAVFGNLGGTTNNTSPTNLIISANKTIGSLRFAQDQNANTKAYNIEFQGGAKLAVVGPGGFSMLRDAKVPLAAQTMDLKLAGAGSLIVSNNSANFANLIDGQLNATLDMRDLDSFYAQVNRLPLGDYRAYPNFFTNGWAGGGTGNEVSRFAPLIYLAKTNVIKAAYVDPNNYDDLGERNYALTIGNYSQQGTTANLRFSLGNSNAFFLDSICFSQALQGGSGHNYNFWTSNSSALFRGVGGLNSRMSVFAIADAASPAPPGNANNRGQVNFANQVNTTVDALVDRLWLGVDRTNNNGQMTLQASLTFSNGVFDANDAFVGYQRSGNNQGAAGATGFAGPEGTVNVNGSALFRINRNLHLGYTTATAAGLNTSAERCFGRVAIGTGTLAVSNVVVGGVTKFSTNNSITLGAGRLFVTNAIGAADGRLASFTANSGGQITLYGVAVGQTNIFVKKLNMVGGASGNAIFNIPTIGGSPAYPVTIPIISYDSALPADPALYAGITAGALPSGVRIQTIVDNTTDKVIEFTFATGAPNLLAWRGSTDNNWDTSTKNWVTVPDGIVTNFVDGDSVIFDDNATGPTGIVIPGTVIPGQISMTNTAKSYSFSGGNVLGGATFFKAGTGVLTNDATFTPGLTLLQGSLAGTGTFGASSLAEGTVMTQFSGTINGGLQASNAVVLITGTVSGGLNLRAGGLTNAGTINGVITLATNVYLDNVSTMNVNLPWTVPTNSTLVNNGTIIQTGPNGGNLGLTVNGLLKGAGKITQDGNHASSDVRVTLGTGGNLMIGNTPNEITNVTLAVRVDFLAGSLTTLDVNNTTPQTDKIFLTDGFIQGKVNFGAGNNAGGTFSVNRIAGPPFDLSTTLSFFDLTSNNPDNVSPAIPGFTPAPGPLLTWDVSHTITNLTLAVTGLPQLTNTITATNITFSWPESYRGWRLEYQSTNLNLGISINPADWTTLVVSLGGTNAVYYPDTNDYSQFYFRSVQPITTTNPAAFFRLTYP